MHCHTVTGSRGRPVCLQPQFIRMSSNSFVYLLPPKNLNPNSYVCQFIRIFSLSKKIEPQFIRMTANSFIYLPSPKKIKPQFIRMSSNSFVYLPPQKNWTPIHSYVFKFIGIFFLKNRAPIHSYIFQIIRICSSAKKPQCAQQSVLLLSHSQSSGCHTVAVGIVTQ